MIKTSSYKPIWGNWESLRIPLIYLLVYILWISLTDYFLLHFVPDLNQYFFFQLIKGTGFVLITATLLFFLLRRYLRILNESTRNLQEMQVTLNTLIDAHPGIVYRCLYNQNWTMQFVSESCHGLTGYHPEELVGDRDISYRDIIHPDDRAQVKERIDCAVAAQQPYELTYRIVSAQNEIRWVWEKGMCREQRYGDDICLEGIIFDCTEIKRAEEEKSKLEDQLRQTQRVEAIGRLAGGVAHDFNNILSVIGGYSELLLKSEQATERVETLAREIKLASGKGANLVRQLLAFGKRQTLEPKVVNLNELIHGLKPMLKSLLQNKIPVEYRLSNALHTIRIDPNRLEQVIMNIVINARDSIQDQGKITIETCEKVIDQAFIDANPGAQAGDYIRLTIRDTGCGMSAETQERIFEPFFTTKLDSGGTGLGMPMAYGIIKQSDGFIWVESEEGKGAAFHIDLPPHTDSESAHNSSPNIGAATLYKDEIVKANAIEETVKEKVENIDSPILVVEDEEPVRMLVSRILEDSNHPVLTASNAHEALELLETRDYRIQLLITDIRMPGMNGAELAQNVRHATPNIKVIFMSGYMDEDLSRLAELKEEYSFLQKPFSPDALLNKVNKALMDGIAD